MHKQLLHLKAYKGKNDIDPASQKIMAEFGNPAQVSKKVPVESDDDSVRVGGSMRQRKFIKKYGKLNF